MRNALCLLVVLIVTGCASPEIVKSWEGADVDNLIMAWGGPDRDYRLPNGGRELTYSHQRLHQGTSLYCKATLRTLRSKVCFPPGSGHSHGKLRRSVHSQERTSGVSWTLNDVFVFSHAISSSRQDFAALSGATWLNIWSYSSSKSFLVGKCAGYFF